MMHSRVDELGAQVVAALERGASVRQAAGEAHVSERTVRNWLREGRQRTTSRFGPVAAAFDGRPATRMARIREAPGGRSPSVAAQRAEPSVAGLPDRDELLCRLDMQSRNGSTTATLALLKETPTQRATEAEDRFQRPLALVPPRE
jgi:hypothetical protein